MSYTVEVHILQNIPPANLNRDDTNAPKDCEFGGYRRGRVSSQSWKRSIRYSPAFQKEVNGQIGIRSQLIAGDVAKRLQEKFNRPEAESRVIARAALSKLISKVGDDGAMSVLFYAGSDELDDLTAQLHAVWETLLPLATIALTPVDSTSDDEKSETPKKEKKKGKKGKETTEAMTALEEATASLVNNFIKAREGHCGTIDIALFGRMLAEQAKMNIDAACQVAHAISTNRVSMDFDYWTAVDELKKEVGAANIGTLGFNSSCFYRYALIDADLLAKNLNMDGKVDEAREHAKVGIHAFIKGAVEAIPSGKQNSFAAQTPPDLVMVVVRKHKAPWSLANAFEKPVRPTENRGLMEESISALDKQWDALCDMYGSEGIASFVVVNKNMNGLNSLASAQVSNLDALVEGVERTLEGHWNHNGVEMP